MLHWKHLLLPFIEMVAQFPILEYSARRKQNVETESVTGRISGLEFRPNPHRVVSRPFLPIQKYDS
jgi:hypothetical protein